MWVDEYLTLNKEFEYIRDRTDSKIDAMRTLNNKDTETSHNVQR